MQAVQETVAKVKSANATEDKLTTMMELQETATEERYKFVRSKLSDVVKYLTPPALEGIRRVGGGWHSPGGGGPAMTPQSACSSRQPAKP